MKKIDDAIWIPRDIQTLKKQNLDTLCQDHKIHEFMVQHGLTREMMDDYWIELLNYQEDYQVCLHCPGLEACPKNTKGYEMTLSFDEGHLFLNMMPCDKENEYLIHQETLSLIDPCNMPLSIFDIKLEDLDLKDRTDVLLACQKFATEMKSKGIYLHGQMQNGKTTVLAALIYKLASKGIPCAFINVPSLIVELKEQFSNTDNKSDLVSRLKTINVLVLDDIGGENVTAWSRDEVIASIVSERALRKLPTFFTSVYSFDELKKYYGLSRQKGDTIKVERLIEKMKAVSVNMELKSQQFRM